ncbi:uncharacterized protein EAF01_004828 [Botrytis porri]|uniref:uncharacterized protein n=1 Tax=Botrytis porri TaxID=87229 RepID=UPI001900FF76|nr:uncharacterized protein EAF01_004828 [Botrytis porri]KAF7907241.1 hypothetical protein EAF01_004828 [Botrytis porri]
MHNHQGNASFISNRAMGTGRNESHEAQALQSQALRSPENEVSATIAQHMTHTIIIKNLVSEQQMRIANLNSLYF